MAFHSALRSLANLAGVRPALETPWLATPVRGYIKAFWEDHGRKRGIDPEYWKEVGHFSYGRRMKVKVPHKRISEVQRYKRASYDEKIQTYSGRRMIMQKILDGRKVLAENRNH